MSRSLNKVTLIGNLTHDPDLRYTPQGTAVCTFSLATNRQWVTDSGEKKDEAEFHRIVAWGKLAEICGQYLSKGNKVYVEGRLQSRDWKTKEGEDRQTVEVVAQEMIILSGKSSSDQSNQQSAQDDFDISQEEVEAAAADKDKGKKQDDKDNSDTIEDDDIPF